MRRILISASLVLNLLAVNSLPALISVVFTKPSPRLPAVPFQVTWAVRQKVTPQGHAVRYGTDRFRNLYWVEAEKLVKTFRRFEYAVHRFAKGSRRLTATKINIKTIQNYLTRRLGRRTDGYSKGSPQQVMEFEDLQTDQRGNLYLRLSLYGHKGDVFLTYRAATGRPELIISPASIAGLARKLGLSTYGVRYKLKVAPQGYAWFIIWNKGKASSNWRRPPALIYGLVRNRQGKWTAKRVVPQFAGGGRYGIPSQYAIRWGAPDWRGGWVFYTGSTLWRLSARGKAVPLVNVKLGSRKNGLSDPIVTRNGDVWFAVNRKYDTSTYGYRDRHSGHFTPTQLWATVGDRSRLIRIRFFKGGKAGIREISSEALLAALRRMGVATKSGVMKTVKPCLDYAGGGLAGFDSHHGMFWVIRPQ